MLVVANFKMNKDKKFYQSLKSLNNLDYKDTKVVLCPPFVYTSFVKICNKNMFLGCQDISFEKEGRATGQISANMLKEFGVKYAIIGHSERRVFETNQDISKKVQVALDNDIVPIVCVGEINKGEDNSLIIEQVASSIPQTDKEIIFAYEPLWAIGSGLIPSKTDINKISAVIRKTAKQKKAKIKVLYGGSVNDKNIDELKKCKVDGFLIGGACLDMNKFTTIIKSVENE